MASSDPAGQGHNLDRETYLKHQAIAIIDQQRVDAAQAIRKKNRKLAKASGIELGDMDLTIKMMGWTIAEIADYFRRKLQFLGFNNIQVGTQFDLFDKSKQAPGSEDLRWAGLMAGMQGKACKPPQNLTQAQQQTWMTGWNEGDRKRSEALADAAAAAGDEDGADEPLAKLDDIVSPENGRAPDEGDSYGDEDNVVSLHQLPEEGAAEPTPAELAAREKAEEEALRAKLGAPAPKGRRKAASALN